MQLYNRGCVNAPAPRPPLIADAVALAPLVSLKLGGPARHLLDVTSDAQLLPALRWAAAQGLPVLVLGGGSNVVVADRGFPGLVLRMATRGLSFSSGGRVTAAAGEPWDDVVAATVERGLAGLECLSGIPGLSGATPIQNVGAYGQEVADTIELVRVLDRTTGAVDELPAAACGFAYRDSAFKRAPDQRIVLSVTFALQADGAPAVRYAELARALAAAGLTHPSLRDVRQMVLGLRAKKSMLLDESDVNGRSVGSFFTNPILPASDAHAVVARAVAQGLASSPADVPQFPMPDGRVKLAAGWLIEHAGIAKGLRRGPVGVSSRHALALVHHGGGTTAELLALAQEVRAAVHTRFGVDLVPEPVMVGDAHGDEPGAVGPPGAGS